MLYNLSLITEEIHQELQEILYKHAKSEILNLRWVKKLNYNEALNIYFKTIRENKKYDYFDEIINENIKTISKEDNWIINSYVMFDIKQNIEQEFKKAWEAAGPIPTWWRKSCNQRQQISSKK